MTDPTATAREVTRFAKIEGKPVLASWMGGTDVAEGAAILREAGIPTFAYPDEAVRIFNDTWRLDANLRQLYETPTLPSDEERLVDRARAEALIAAVRAEGRTLLTEDESKELLAAYGIPITETVVAPTADEAVARGRQDRLPGRRQALLPHDHPQDRRRRRPAEPQGRGGRAPRLRVDPGVGHRAQGRRALRGRHRPADGQLDRLRADPRQLRSIRSSGRCSSSGWAASSSSCSRTAPSACRRSTRRSPGG